MRRRSAQMFTFHSKCSFEQQRGCGIAPAPAQRIEKLVGSKKATFGYFVLRDELTRARHARPVERIELAPGFRIVPTLRSKRAHHLYGRRSPLQKLTRQSLLGRLANLDA